MGLDFLRKDIVEKYKYLCYLYIQITLPEEQPWVLQDRDSVSVVVQTDVLPPFCATLQPLDLVCA